MNIDIKSIGTLIDELITTDIKCYMEQEKIMTAAEGENITESALKTQKLNARRNQLMRAIDKRLNESELSLTEKTYSSGEPK